LCKSEVVNLARVYARSKVLAADNSSLQDTYARDTDTDKLRSLKLVNLDYHFRHIANALDEKL